MMKVLQQILHWIFSPLIIWEIYYCDKKSKYGLDVTKIYQSLWAGALFMLWGTAVLLILLSDSLHIALLYLLGLLLLPLAFTYPFIQNFVLKRKKYVETLLEQYNAMEPEEQSSQAREGWYHRVLPVIGFAVLLLLFMASYLK
jgi:hypothetical protein